MRKNKLSSLNHFICTTIHRLRLKKGISQEELAHIAGIDRSYLSGIERKSRNMTISTLEKLIPHICRDYKSFLNELMKDIDAK